jgi:hypothetical protein
LVVLLIMAPLSQELEPPINPERFSTAKRWSSCCGGLSFELRYYYSCFH